MVTFQQPTNEALKAMSPKRVHVIYDAHGEPIDLRAAAIERSSREAARLKSFDLGAATQQGYADRSVSQQLRDPVSAHWWLAAACLAMQMVTSQVPLVVMREKPDPTTSRTRRFGLNRRSTQRFLRDAPLRRRSAWARGAEPFPDHELSRLLERPNEWQSGSALVGMTAMNLLIHGEFVWVYTDVDGIPMDWGSNPEAVWPMQRSAMTPIRRDRHRGPIIGYEFQAPDWWPSSARKVAVTREQVTEFRVSSMADPTKGFDRLRPLYALMEIDILNANNDRSILRAGGVPSSVFETATPKSAEEMRAFEAQAKEILSTAGGALFLPYGLSYRTVQQTGSDLGSIAQGDRSREATLGVTMTPPSQLGKTDTVNYATSLSQRAVFIESNVIPMLSLIETALDGTLLYPEGDDTFAGFDYSGVDALRAGVADKVGLAAQLAGPVLRMPPRDALALAGVDAPEYAGDDAVLVSPVLAPIEAVIDPLDSGDGGGADELAADPSDDSDPAADPDEDPTDEPKARQPIWHLKAKKRFKWDEWLALHRTPEKLTREGYVGWVAKARKETLAALDAQTRSWSKADPPADLSKIIPDEGALKRDLVKRMRQPWAEALEKIYSWTESETGIAVIEIDDERLLAAIARREQVVGDKTPKRLRANLRKALETAVREGETVQEIRDRVETVYRISASSSRALTIARTNVVGLMNDVRDQMFEAAGFETESWLDSKDEATRASHRQFGEAGSKPRGFNFLEVVSRASEGRLEFPGDSRAPAKEVVNCRCAKVVDA